MMPARLSRGAAVVGITLVLSVVLAAIGFGTLNALPTASRADRLAVAVLQELARIRRTSSEIHLAGRRPMSATCVRRNNRELVTARGLRITLDGPRIVGQPRRSEMPEYVVVAIADLAVCPGVASAELVNRVLAGPVPGFLALRWHRRLAYRFRISHDRPMVLLYVFRKNRSPIGAVLVGRRVHGWSIVRAVRTRRPNGGPSRE